jgi:hypothetical protein
MKTHFPFCTSALARTLAAVIALLASSPGWSEHAHAEEAPAEENVSAAPAIAPGSPSNPKGQRNPDWGWLVIGPSLVAGAACTGYGLLHDCAGADKSCSRTASLAIWGGVGIASLGSIVGMALLQPWAASRQATAGAVDLQIELSVGSHPAGSSLPGGALLRLAGPLYW